MHGMNFGFVNYYESSRPLIDCFRLGPVPTAGAFDPITALPTGADALAVNRMVPADLGKYDYVLLCDSNVTQFRTNTGVTVVPKDGRATFSVERTAVPDMATLVKASGPVKKLALIRADHEAAYLAGEVFNPDFLAKVKGFTTYRPLDWNVTNGETYPAQNPRATDAFFTPDRGGMPPEYQAQLASRMSAKLWFNVHHMMPDQQVLERLHLLDANAGGSAIDLEFSNEWRWNNHAALADTQTKARYNLSTVGVDDARRYYGYRAGMLANLAASVSKRFRVNICDQFGNPATRKADAFLAGWDEAKAPRSLIAGYAVAPYFGTAKGDAMKLVAMFQANDAESFFAFYSAKVDANVAQFAPTRELVVKPMGTEFKLYEHNEALTTSAPNIADATLRNAFLAWALPLIHSDRMADLVMRNVHAAFDAGVTEACYFNLSNPGSQSGAFGAMAHVACDPYPVYNRLQADNKPKADYASLAAEVAAMQRTLAELQGRIAAAAVG